MFSILTINDTVLKFDKSASPISFGVYSALMQIKMAYVKSVCLRLVNKFFHSRYLDYVCRQSQISMYNLLS